MDMIKTDAELAKVSGFDVSRVFCFNVHLHCSELSVIDAT